MELRKYPDFEILWNITGNSAYVLTNDIERYYMRISDAIDDLENDKKEGSSYLAFAFIALSAATLEYTLNLMSSCYSLNEFKKNEQWNNLTYEKLRDKLLYLVRDVSGRRYQLNKNNNNIKNLLSLIKLRNKLMHNTEAVKISKNKMPNINAQINDGGLVIPRDKAFVECVIKTTGNIVDTLTKKQCIRIGKSLIAFKDKVAAPYLTYHDFEENDMVIANS